MAVATGKTQKLASATLAKVWKEYEDYLEYGDVDKSERMHFPSGVLLLNKAIGHNDGMTSGIVQIIGDEATGKTTLALDILATSQKERDLTEVELPDGRQINALFLDFERTYDGKYAKTIGVDTSKLLVIKTPYAESAFNLTEELLVAGIQFIIIDSIAMVIPKSEEEKDYDDNVKVAGEAGLIGRALKRLNQLADNADSLIILINQWRSNMSPMAMTEKKPYGARIIKHVIKASIELRRTKREDTTMMIEAFVSKTKMGATGQKIQYQIKHGYGIDYAEHILNIAVDKDVIMQTSKARYEYNGIKAYGIEQAKNNFPFDEIRSKVIAVLDGEIDE